jgi:hypothetical protein
MARLTIEMFRLPNGRTAGFRVSLASDEDSTPREHEQTHRRAVCRLIEGLTIDADSARFHVEREQAALQPTQLPSDDGDGYEVIDLG